MSNERKMNGNNIILLQADALRADHLSCYGSEEVHTPNIDKLAEDGVLFKNAFANGSATVTSVSSFLTSNLPPHIEKKHPTISTILQKKGYNTTSFNPNVQLVHGFCRRLNLKKEFDLYETLLAERREKYEKMFEEAIGKFARVLNYPFFKESFLLKLASEGIGFAPVPTAKPAPRADELNSKGISVLKNNSKPTFLWLFYLDTHEPYLPPQKNFKNNKRIISINRKMRYFGKNALSNREIRELHESYKDEIEYFDRQIGDLINKLKRNGYYSNSTIIFTADHGEQFDEHGELGHGALYEEVVKVPLAIKPSSRLKTKKRIVKTNVSLLDLGPTIADISKTESRTFIGQSLIHFLSKKTINKYEEKPIFTFKDINGHEFCFRKGNWKIIQERDKIELYNLEKDPEEKNNLFQNESRVAQDLRKEAYLNLKRIEKLSKTSFERERIKKATKKLRKL